MTTVSQVVNNFLYDQVQDLTGIDFWNKVMQFDNDATSIASGEATFLFAVPPVFKPAYLLGGKSVPISDLAVPIGGVQSYNLNEGKAVMPFPELGSRLKRVVTGSGQYSAGLGRVLALHSDLYYSCYSWVPVFMNNGAKNKDVELQLAMPPGVNGQRHFVTMESDIFGIPFGLLCISGTAGGDVIHVEVLERCYFQGGGGNRVAGQPLVTESVSIYVTRPVPFVDSEGNNMFNFDIAKRKAYTLAAPNLTGR